MNEVGQLITEAMQGVLDKINTKDKVIQANKNQIRIQDTKFKQLQQEVIGLMKLRKQNDELFKSLKNIHATIEDNQNSFLERSGKVDYSIKTLTETVGQHHAQLSSNRVISENQHRRIEECFH